MSRFIRNAVFIGVSCLLCVTCTTHRFQYQADPSVHFLAAGKPAYPAATFAVLSDTHLYDTRLGSSGKAFQSVLKRDRKLLLESEEILETAAAEIIREKSDFLIICGDLTKDGERMNHMKMQSLLSRIAENGVPVYVVPGNHDVANPKSFQFKGKDRIPVETVSGEMFADIYADFGYGNARYRDTDSLSYVAEPVPGLWLLALDSCRWKENRPGQKPFADGAFSASTLQWIETVLIDSKKQQKAVIGFMHHGILEHYHGNENYFPWYVVQDHEIVSRLLAQYGVSLVFTGHFHAQDITEKRFEDLNTSLFDVETGSLLTYPSPYRVVRIQEGWKAVIESRFMRSIPSRPDNFSSYSKTFVFRNTQHIIDGALKKYWVSKEDRKTVAPDVARAYITHLSGDEQMPESVVTTEGLGIWGRMVIWMRQDLLEAWYMDLPPADHFLEIDLQTGKYVEPANREK